MSAWKIHRLPRYLRYWRCITGVGGFDSPAQRRDFILVFSACRIPWRLCQIGGREFLYVPIAYERLARDELSQYKAESRFLPPAPSVALHSFWQFAPLYVLPLLVFHATLPLSWESHGSLQGSAVLLRHEWMRFGTSLSIHADWGHAAANVFFGSIFLCALARLCGVGRAWLLAFLGGFIGNGLSVCLHSLAYASVGFSTAVFATLGALAGLYICQKHDRLYLPLAAALALLAMLGTEGPRTDYVAHLCGLASGLVLGIGQGLFQRCHWPQMPQWAAGILAILLPIACWYLAETR